MAYSQKISPSVMSNAGHVMKANNLSIEWTLGELATETLKANNLIITQGFHQTNLTVVSTNDPFISGFSVYPNPFQHELIIQNESGKKIAIHLFNIMGQCISDYTILPGTQQIQLNGLPAGTYILEAKTNDQKQHFTLEKIK
jgi:hypothetical protein